MIITITAKEAKAVMDADSTVVVLDVRTPEEYAEGHIAHAVNLPIDQIDALQPANLPDKEATILVYCHSGYRSAQAAKKLAVLGYTDVRDLGGHHYLAV